MSTYNFFNVFRNNVLNEDIVEDAKFFLLGVGFDSTETNIPGQRLGPQRIRDALMHKDITYDPAILNDFGDVLSIPGNAQKTLENIESALKEIDDHDLFSTPILLGGEHTITLAPVRYLKKKYKELQLINLDAHYDFKDEYLGESLNHSTVMRRISEMGVKIAMVGVRRWDEEEQEYAKKYNLSLDSLDPSLPTYLSIDLDYFDPSIAPGVGDKENGGAFFKEFLDIIKGLKKERFNMIGFDVMELNPLIDSHDQTAVLASDVIIKIIETFQ